MKYILLTIVTLSLSCLNLNSQSNVNIDFTKEKNINAIILANINGNVKVNGNKRGSILLSGTKTIEFKDNSKVELKHVVYNDTLIIYIESPCSTLKLDNQGKYQRESWSVYNWEQHEKCDEQPEFKYDLTLSLPHSIPLAVSTINNGDINVKGYDGHLWVNNINGSVSLEMVTEVHQAKTINGNVTIHFSKAPSVEGNFYSLNGDIESFYPAGINMDMTFKSFMGDFYTDNDNLKSLPTTTTKEKSNSGFKLKIGEKSKMRIGKGGLIQNFETFNGDAIVRTKTRK